MKKSLYQPVSSWIGKTWTIYTMENLLNQPTPPQAAGYGCSHKVVALGV
jgi:hypothetical protein